MKDLCTSHKTLYYSLRVKDFLYVSSTKHVLPKITAVQFGIYKTGHTPQIHSILDIIQLQLVIWISRVSITGHGIRKCCSPTIRKTDRKCSTTNERITAKCWFRLEKCIRCRDSCQGKRVGKDRSSDTTSTRMLGRITSPSGLALHHCINVGECWVKLSR
jgi:hypothetical protein